MRQPIPLVYRRPLVGQLDQSYRNSLIASASLGLVFLLAVLIVPKPATQTATMEAVPERLAKLILEKERSKPGAPAPAPAPRGEIEKPAEVAQTEPAAPPAAPPKPPTSTPRRSETVKPAPDRGKIGRERAQQDVTRQVASVTKSLDESLNKLAEVLPATETKSGGAGAARARGRERNVRGGRGSSEIGQVAALSSGAGAEVGGGLGGATVSLGSASEFGIQGGDGAGGSGSGGSGGTAGNGNGGDVRSNASLLAVVKRYAAGIQYCYDDALKAKPDLRGKLVLSITVAADGSVRDVNVVQDKLQSSGVRDCVLAQVSGWRFPAVDAGEVTFQTPFVFTPGG